MEGPSFQLLKAMQKHDRPKIPFPLEAQSTIPIGEDTSCGIETDKDNALLLNEYIKLHYRFQQKLNLIAARVLKMPVKSRATWYLNMLTQFRRLLQNQHFHRAVT